MLSCFACVLHALPPRHRIFFKALTVRPAPPGGLVGLAGTSWPRGAGRSRLASACGRGRARRGGQWSARCSRRIGGGGAGGERKQSPGRGGQGAVQTCSGCRGHGQRGRWLQGQGERGPRHPPSHGLLHPVSPSELLSHLPGLQVAPASCPRTHLWVSCTEALPSVGAAHPQVPAWPHTQRSCSPGCVSLVLTGGATPRYLEQRCQARVGKSIKTAGS